MNELTTFQALMIVIGVFLIFISIMRIVLGLGYYLDERAKYYKTKTRILKNKNKNIFNKWYD